MDNFHLVDSFFLPSRSCPAITRKPMSATYQGASGPSGHAGLRAALGPPVSGSHAAPKPVLTRLEQPSQERLVSNQIRKLTVRFLVDMFDLVANKIPGGTRTLLKCSWNSIRFDSVPLTNYPSESSIGVVSDERNDRHFVGTLGWAGLRDECGL